VAGADGLIYGGTSFFVKQLVAVTAASVYAFIFTYIMLIVINMFTPVKVDEKSERIGLDEALHGERAYDEGVL
jgi:Amt family ammonium transporter